MNNKSYQTFMTIWFGQLVSRMGTAVTRFALIIWAYKQTDNATDVALLGFCAFIPMVAISPFAGVWVDRLDRRKIMMVSDLGAGVTTLMLLILFTTGQLQVWHLYLIEAFSGLFEAFQGPAYTALTSQLLPEEEYTRASGLRSIADDGGNLVAPFLAGFLIVQTGVIGIIGLDLLTLGIAVVTLVVVKKSLVGLPSSSRSTQTCLTERHSSSIRQFGKEMKVGFRYIQKHRGLSGLMIIYTTLNFIDALAWLSLLPVMILARSGGDEMALAAVEGTFGFAGIVGGILVAYWGGPKRKIHGALLGPAFSFILGGIIIAVGRSTTMWMLGAGMAMIFVPILSGSEKAIWQTKVTPALQGRVLATLNMVRKSMVPLGMLCGGFLADNWFEPAMMSDGHLVSIFGSFVGTGPGAGMAVLFLLTAFIGCGVSLSGYLFPAVRYIEDDLPQKQSLGVSTETAVFQPTR